MHGGDEDSAGGVRASSDTSIGNVLAALGSGWEYKLVIDGFGIYRRVITVMQESFLFRYSLPFICWWGK
jgi:hypothetical protein